MSTRIMALVWPLQMPPTQKAVLISLADNANDQGDCWPSITTIGERTCLGRTAVINAIKSLETAGLLVADRSNGRHTKYLINVAQLDLFGRSNQSVRRTGTADGLVREAHQSAGQTGTADGRNQSARRTAPVREADTNRQEPSRTKSLKTKPSPAASALPDPPSWLDRGAWDGFVAMRKRIRFPLTPRAAELIFRELETLADDPNKVLDQSTRNGWRDVYALKTNEGNRNGTNRESAVDRTRRLAVEGELRDRAAAFIDRH